MIPEEESMTRMREMVGLVREGFAPTFLMQVYWQDESSSRTLDR